AGGFGLTLTEADYVFLLDPWWNPAVEAQAVDRAHRIGQDKNVMVYRMVSKGSIEEKVLALQQQKIEMFAALTEDDTAFASNVTADDIRALFDDSPVDLAEMTDVEIESYDRCVKCSSRRCVVMADMDRASQLVGRRSIRELFLSPMCHRGLPCGVGTIR